ncbi:heterokaryon incompatibility protein-domain-containing protein [Halenospora varia]|nr:heterokaryon incompatibility protein-domain-containing protein [Halenospora varia]
MAFKHKTLEHPWQLRLVELLPRATEDPNETIRCKIWLTPGADAASLDLHYDKSQDVKLIPYRALSYCWGDSAEAEHIELDGMEFMVRRNLFEYLKQRRESAASVMLWIDAICIDQSNIAERNAQVPRMTSIYINATAIEISLGPEEDGSSLAIDELGRLARAVRKARAEQGRTPLDDLVMPVATDLEKDELEWVAILSAPNQTYNCLAAETLQGNSIGLAISSLWARPWWNRVWVAQEASVPGSNKVFCCGDRSISWLHLMISAGVLHNYIEKCLPLPRDLFSLGSSYLPDSIPHLVLLTHTGEDPIKLLIVQQRRMYKEIGIPMPFYTLGALSRRLLATDDRDRVYAFLGMATDINLAGFSPDYSKSVEEVYQSMTQYLIYNNPYTNMLDILSEAHDAKYSWSETAVGEGKEVLPLPSWVPDWRIPRPTISLLKNTLNIPKGQIPWKNFYAASGQDPGLIRKHWGSDDLVTFQGEEMRICGIRLDEIEHLTEFKVTMDKVDGFSRQLPIGSKRAWNQLRKSIPFYLGPLYRTAKYGLESIYDAFRRTVCADLYYNGNGDMGMLPLTRGATMVDSGDDQVWLGNDYTSSFGRKLAVTRGNFMGLVSAEAQVGDEIFVLAGGQVLHTLRRQGDYYTYLGDCYLHGLMDGEALERLEKGTAKLETVHVR